MPRFILENVGVKLGWIRVSKRKLHIPNFRAGQSEIFGNTSWPGLYVCTCLWNYMYINFSITYLHNVEAHLGDDDDPTLQSCALRLPIVGMWDERLLKMASLTRCIKFSLPLRVRVHNES